MKNKSYFGDDFNLIKNFNREIKRHDETIRDLEQRLQELVDINNLPPEEQGEDVEDALSISPVMMKFFNTHLRMCRDSRAQVLEEKFKSK